MHTEEVFWCEPIIPRAFEDHEVSLKTIIPRNRKDEKFESLISMIRMDRMPYFFENLGGEIDIEFFTNLTNECIFR